MASFDFPASPNDNDTYSLNGVTYKYVAAKQRWEIVPTPHNFETTAQLDIRDTANRDRANHTGTQDVSTITGLNSVTTSVTAPSSPIAGDVWWDSETGDKYIYYVDADGGQWVQSSTSSNLLTADVGTAAYLDVEEVTTPADIANIESIIGAISPTGGLNTSISIPLSPYGVNAYAYTNQPLLGRYFPYDLIVSSVSLTLDTAPTGSAFIVDIKQNGVSVFSGLLTVADGQTGSSTYTFANSLTLFSAGDLITLDVTQVGATTPGKYPVLTIEGIRGDVQSVVVPLSPLEVNATLKSDLALLGRSFSFDFQIDDIILTLDTAPTGSSFIVDIKLNTVSIFSTLLSVDDGEDTSTTATTAYALSTTPTTITKGDLVTFSITQIGATVPGKYPVVTMIGREV